MLWIHSVVLKLKMHVLYLWLSHNRLPRKQRSVTVAWFSFAWRLHPYPSFMFLFLIWSLVSKHDVRKPPFLSQGYRENVLLSCARIYNLVSWNCGWNRVCFHGPGPRKHINTKLSAGKLALPQTKYWCLPFPALLINTNSSLTTCDATVPVAAGSARKFFLVLHCVCGQVKSKLVFRDCRNCSWCWT